ncbi:MAG: hypothetical protein LBR80_05095 [Deltaproteobacteria bacterium]|jgi:hypothetical protein|nr:hypothetical protein [Deltaproteobacteria bacterium]
MSDATKYLDENGNDLRYGHYFHKAWIPDPPAIVSLKKSGEWDKLTDLQRRWALRDSYEFDEELLELVREDRRRIKRILKERKERKGKI